MDYQEFLNLALNFATAILLGALAAAHRHDCDAARRARDRHAAVAASLGLLIGPLS